MDKAKSNVSRIFLTGIFLLILVAGIAFFYQQNPDFFSNLLSKYGLPGLFLGSVLINASILLSIPIMEPIIFLLSSAGLFGLGVFDPLAIGIAAGFGAAIGELSGYIIGRMGSASIKGIEKPNSPKLAELKDKISNLGMVFITLGAFLPFPFDLIGIASGIARYDPKKFFIACAIGKISRYTVVAYAGFFSIGLLRAIFVH